MKWLHLRTKDMKQIVNSNWWNVMHIEMEVNHCDYQNRNNNRNCMKVKKLECEDCRVYKLGLYQRESEVN